MKMKAPRINSPRYPHYAASSHDILAMLGVKKLPPEGMPERLIEGIRVYVRPLIPRPGVRRNFQGLRVRAICQCGRDVAVGRLHQHRCKPAPITGVPNLDALDSSELMSFWMKHRRGRGYKILFPVGGPGSMIATGSLANYASNIATAKNLRTAGDIAAAVIYETIADRIYSKLPEWAKW